MENSTKIDMKMNDEGLEHKFWNKVIILFFLEEMDILYFQEGKKTHITHFHNYHQYSHLGNYRDKYFQKADILLGWDMG